MLRATEVFEWILCGKQRWRAGLLNPVTALQQLLEKCCPRWGALHGIRYCVGRVLVERHKGVLDNCFLHGVYMYDCSLKAARDRGL